MSEVQDYYGFELKLNSDGVAVEKTCKDCGSDAEWVVNGIKCPNCHNSKLWDVPIKEATG